MKKLKNNKGFTFIELIAVMIIIAILSTVVIHKMGFFDKSAEEITTNFEDKANTRKDTYYKLLTIEERSEEDKELDKRE